MKINLNEHFTTQDVAQLIASRDDSQHRQLRVTKAGEAYLSDIVGVNDISGLAFRLETCTAGNGYTGHTAAADPKYVALIEKVLRNNWPIPSSTYIDWF